MVLILGVAMGKPWDDWIPGVLNREQMVELCREGLIIGEESLVGAISKSAIDLSLSEEAYEMTQGSVKPSGAGPYGWFIKQAKLAEQIRSSRDGTFPLGAMKTYVFKLNERLNTEGLKQVGIHGQATAKSSIGRVDVLARLIVDGMNTYESFDPHHLANQTGDMYLEITPITFDVTVKPGISLSQLRLFYGEPEEAQISGPHLFKTVLKGSGAQDGSLTVDLSNVVKGGLPVAAYCAIAKTGDSIPLWEKPKPEKPEPWKYWRFAATDGTKRLKIKETQFYILRSKEKISVPEGIAIYCRASDETLGEMRIHYAGFVHPIFGKYKTKGTQGTPLMFEVRGHQVNVSLVDGEKLANLKFYRMSKDYVLTEKEKKEVEQHDKANEETSYNEQDLQLSNILAEWPPKLRRIDDVGTVEPA